MKSVETVYIVVSALKFQQLMRKCIVMLNLSHNNLIQKVIGIRNASALLQRRKIKNNQTKPNTNKGKKKKKKRETKGFLENISLTTFVNSILLPAKTD